jgi:hypothetical protein
MLSCFEYLTKLVAKYQTTYKMFIHVVRYFWRQFEKEETSFTQS